MNLSIKTLIVASTLAWAGASQAVPMQYNFQYTTLGGDVLAGSLNGDLQGDGNTIVVGSILDFVTFNGVAVPSLSFVKSALDFYISPPLGRDPTVSLDGSVMDIIACSDSQCFDGFAFEGSGSYAGFPMFAADFEVDGARFEVFDADSWQIRASVPEPGSLALVGLALSGLGAMRRRA